jgi:hypothetical protein
MAKGKHAAALFEVINGGKRDRARGTAADPKPKLDTPKWWFKSRKHDRGAAGGGGAGPLTATPTSAPPMRVAMPVAPRLTESFDIPAASPAPKSTESRQSRDAGAGKFRIPLPSSQAVAFGLMVAAIFGVGFVVGQKFRPYSVPVIADETTAELLAGDARPDVLELGSPGSLTPAHATEAVQSATTTDDLTTGTTAAAAPGFTGASVDTTALLNAHVPTTSVVEEKQRVVGFNYVVIQTYPDKADAVAAIGKLSEAGIGASLVKGVVGWRKDWFCVVGSKGFDRIRNNDQYDRYLAAIGRVSDRFAGKSKWKQFQPSGYKWRGVETDLSDH